MTQEDKELLLKDLCARLPYGVKVQHQHEEYLDEIQTIEHISRQYGEIETESVLGFVDDFKPYLRPMSSMTEEEKSYYEDRWFEGYHTKHGDDMVSEPEIPSYIDWLNAHHFDYRGLISKGLALEAPEGMYKMEEQQ